MPSAHHNAPSPLGHAPPITTASSPPTAVGRKKEAQQHSASSFSSSPPHQQHPAQHPAAIAFREREVQLKQKEEELKAKEAELRAELIKVQALQLQLQQQSSPPAYDAPSAPTPPQISAVPVSIAQPSAENPPLSSTAAISNKVVAVAVDSQPSQSSAAASSVPLPSSSPSVPVVVSVSPKTRHELQKAVARQKERAKALVAASPHIWAPSRERPSHVYCLTCKKSILSDDSEAHLTGRKHQVALHASSHWNDVRQLNEQRACPLLHETFVRTNMSNYEVAKDVVARFGPIIRHSPANMGTVCCSLCPGVEVNARIVEKHIAGHEHRTRVESLRSAYFPAYQEAMKKSDRRQKRYEGQYRKRLVEGVRPSSDGIDNFKRQTVRDRKDRNGIMPEHYAALYKNDFPTRNEMRSAREELDVFARYELSTSVEWWDPLAPQGFMTEMGKSYGELVDARRKLGVMAVLLQATSGHLEISGYNRRSTPEAPLEFKQISEKYFSPKCKDGLVARWSVAVPGVAENRPSVLRGDITEIYSEPINVTASTPPLVSTAFVHFVNDDAIVFEMPETFREGLDATKYKLAIAFKYKPTQEGRLVSVMQTTDQNAFLYAETCTEGGSNHTYQSVFRGIETKYEAEQNVLGSLNEQQRKFIHHVHGPNRLTVLFGPPGTGKTTTMVAAVVDTLFRARRSGVKVRILICSPSNQASDVIAERVVLHEALSSEDKRPDARLLLRLPSFSYDPKAVRGSLLPYCPKIVSGGFDFPDRAFIESHKIVVCTLMNSDRLHAIGIEASHFTHLFVDEAGHATEELLAVALRVCGNRYTDSHKPIDKSPVNTKVVLAGDHKQLGPYVTLPSLLDAKMHFSPLLRIHIDASFWSKVGHQLLTCYRCDKSIVRLINAFYDDSLIADRSVTRNSFTDLWKSPWMHKLWKHHCATQQLPLDTPPPVPAAPLIAINHAEPESREKDSPSWMNAWEVDCAVSAAIQLWDSKLVKSFSEIAIISPYRKQVSKIQQRLWSTMIGRKDLSDKMEKRDALTGDLLRRPRVPIRVATIDSFQGAESRVVILCCVRSNVKASMGDVRFGLGFIGQPERANVAMSRAQELLIVIGNRRLLVHDALWQEYFDRLDEIDLKCGGGVVINVASNAGDSEEVGDGLDLNNDGNDGQCGKEKVGDGIGRMAEERCGVFRFE